MACFFMAKMENYNLQKLTAQEIQELQTDKAMRVVEENSNTLIDIEKDLYNALMELGKWRIKVEQLKSIKAMVIEQNRALKTVVSNG